MSIAVVMAVSCNWCSRQISPADVLPIPSGQLMCGHCREWHQHALDVLSGQVPRGCQECGQSMREIGVVHRDQIAIPMFVMQKDGIYQVLCRVCCDTYMHKRKELFKNTHTGEQFR